MLNRFASVVIAALTISPNVWAQPFLPPGLLNPGGNTDSKADWAVSHVVDARGAFHAVWISDVDYTGNSGPDRDFFYSRNDGSGWSQPVLVNTYGTLDGSGYEDNPRLVLGPDETLHCVWTSMESFLGTGSDYDIFYSRNSGSGWTNTEVVNNFGASDGASDHDFSPNITIGLDGRVVVAWESAYALPPFGIGPDKDILYAVRTGPNTWTPAQPLNSNAATDSGDDEGPIAMTTAADGDIIAVWSTNDNFRPADSIGTDSDIVFSVFPPNGSWSTLLEVTGLATTDSGNDYSPAVLAIGSGSNREIHFVWTSKEPVDGSGNDYDVLHAVRTPSSPLPPANPAWLVNSNAKTDGGALADESAPSLCVEPGGVIHCVWHVGDVWTGATETDVYHSTNATKGSAWSPLDLVNLNGLFDGSGENDRSANIVCTPNGSLSVVWESDDDLGGLVGNDTDIFHALGASRGVSRPELINIDGAVDNPAQSSDADADVALALAPDGTLHAVWSSDYAGIAGGTTGSDHDIFHAKLGSAGWGQPDLVNTNGLGDTGNDWSPTFAIDSQGTLHVVWESDENVGGAVGTDVDIFYTSNGGSGWTAPEPVNSNAKIDSLGDYPAQIAVAPDGTIHVVWESEWSASGAPPASASNISYAFRDGAAWSTTELVNGAYAMTHPGSNEDPDLLIGDGGTLHVVWESNANFSGAGTDDDIFYSSRSGSSWTTPEFVNDAANDASNDGAPKIAMTPNGKLHVVWPSDLDVQGAGTDDDIVYSSRGGSGWTAVQLLSALGASDTGSDARPDIAADQNGSLHIVWQSDERLLFNAAGADWDIFYVRISFPATFPSGAPVILANAAGYADDGDEWWSQVLIDHEGYVHFAWNSDDSLGGTIGLDRDVLHSRTNFPTPGYTGASRWQRYR